MAEKNEEYDPSSSSSNVVEVGEEIRDFTGRIETAELTGTPSVLLNIPLRRVKKKKENEAVLLNMTPMMMIDPTLLNIHMMEMTGRVQVIVLPVT